MFAASRRWFRRNRTPLAIGLGLVGAGYVATQYVLRKLNDARSDRIAKENLRRRFAQSQEDCTFTVWALLPTALLSVVEVMNTEGISYEIQQLKGTTGSESRSSKSKGSTSPPSISATNATEEDGRSLISAASESGVHASQVVQPTGHVEISGDNEAAKKPTKTKRQLWDDLVISSITRAFTLIYLVALLTMLTRIQLNLLGRRSYLSSVVSLATASTHATINLENNDDHDLHSMYGSNKELNRKYLTFSWWLLNRGWLEIMLRVEMAVRRVFGELSPRDRVTYEHFARLTREVRVLVEGSDATAGHGTRWLSCLLPAPDLEDYVLRESGILGDDVQTSAATEPVASSPSSTVSLRRLLDETSDLIESPAFSSVLTQLLDVGFSHLLEKKIREGVFEAPFVRPTGSPLLDSPVERAVILPKILAVLTRQAHVIGNGMPNEYLQEMETIRDLEGFAAVVYSSNWEAEMAPNDKAAASALHVASGVYPSVQQSQVSGMNIGEESMVVVDAQSTLDGAWDRATGQV